MKTGILVSLITTLFAIGSSGLFVSYAGEFEWGDTTALKEHLEPAVFDQRAARFIIVIIHDTRIMRKCIREHWRKSVNAL